jgi:hypothetical protein
MIHHSPRVLFDWVQPDKLVQVVNRNISILRRGIQELKWNPFLRCLLSMAFALALSIHPRSLILKLLLDELAMHGNFFLISMLGFSS